MIPLYSNNPDFSGRLVGLVPLSTRPCTEYSSTESISTACNARNTFPPLLLAHDATIEIGLSTANIWYALLHFFQLLWLLDMSADPRTSNSRDSPPSILIGPVSGARPPRPRGDHGVSSFRKDRWDQAPLRVAAYARLGCMRVALRGHESYRLRRRLYFCRIWPDPLSPLLEITSRACTCTCGRYYYYTSDSSSTTAPRLLSEKRCWIMRRGTVLSLFALLSPVSQKRQR